MGSRVEKKPAVKVRVSKEVYRKKIVKNIFAVIGVLLAVAVLIYVAVAATLVRFLFSSTMGFTLIKNPNYRGNIAPVGQLVYITPKGTDFSVGDNLKNAFTPHDDACVAEVLAGPYGEINYTKKLSSVDDKILPVNLYKEPKNQYLANQYVVVGIDGNCNKKKSFIIKREQIVGVPVNYEKYKDKIIKTGIYESVTKNAKEGINLDKGSNKDLNPKRKVVKKADVKKKPVDNTDNFTDNNSTDKEEK